MTINMKFPDMDIGVIILKTVLFTLLYNMVKLLPISDHDMDKNLAKINLHLTKTVKLEKWATPSSPDAVVSALVPKWDEVFMAVAMDTTEMDVAQFDKWVPWRWRL
jgi:hypothetical protein